jgi:arsenate reductase (thioredoxin)
MDKKYNILFICTENSGRSILAEVVANTFGKERFHGYSAGSNPGIMINPVVKELATELGYDINKLYSKSWDEFAKKNSPKMDIIITVCDSAAAEVCPAWPGHPSTCHWGFPDPSHVKNTNNKKMKKAYLAILNGLERRFSLLLNLPIHELDSVSLNHKLKEIHLASE